jgi:ABC-type polysaccharide/polyol phosphate transport system ATPase subunit
MTGSCLKLQDVGITFEGQLSTHDTLKGWLAHRLRLAGRSRAKAASTYRVDALDNVNLEIKQGERVGLIGLNGAGKSTLLKVMAGIYPPTSGSIVSRGHVCPMFEFATGFEMNQSGWDNIRIRGLLLGMSPDEIEGKLPEIAAFTELGGFLDYPVRTYSSGMFIRLAFAVSTSINPEILLIDEVMGAGDIKFAEKAKGRMLEFMEQGKILVFSSHSFDLLKSFCGRTIWLEKGKVVMDGQTDAVVNAYKRFGASS